MTIKQDEKGGAHVWLNRDDVESAIRQFIVTCQPEFSIGFIVNPMPDEIIQGAYFKVEKGSE